MGLVPRVHRRGGRRLSGISGPAAVHPMERRRHHAGHHAGRSPVAVRPDGRVDAGAGTTCARRRCVRSRDDGRAVDAAGARESVHRALSAGTRRPRQRVAAARGGTRHARGRAWRARMAHRRLRRDRCAPSGSGARAGVRTLPRPRGVAKRRYRTAPLAGAHAPAAWRRGGHRRYQVARRSRRDAVSAVGALVRRPSTRTIRPSRSGAGMPIHMSARSRSWIRRLAG